MNKIIIIYSLFAEVKIHEKSQVELAQETVCKCIKTKYVRPSAKRNRNVTLSASVALDENSQPVVVYGVAVKSLKKERPGKPNAEARSKAVARQILLSKINSKFKSDFISLKSEKIASQLFMEEKINQILNEIIAKIEEVNSVRRFLKEYTEIIDSTLFGLFDAKDSE